MGRMFTNTHPALTLAIKSATVAQAQCADKNFPFEQPTWTRSDCSKYMLLQNKLSQNISGQKNRGQKL